jgi:hypothetical protein
MDGGCNPPMNDIITQAWIAHGVEAGTPIAARFEQGRHIHRRTWITVAVILLTVTGAVLLGKAFASRGAAAEVKAPAPENDAASEIALLEKRHARGEITEFELRARKAALSQTPKPAPASTEPGDIRATVDAIERRAAAASPEELRRDVGVLAALLRELLRR